MTLSWNILALTLIGAQEQPPSPPIIPRSPTSIEIRISRSHQADHSDGKVVVSCRDQIALGGLSDLHNQACALLDEICANLCPDGLVDERTVAAFARPAGVASSSKSAPAKDHASTSPPTCSDMSKVAKPRLTGDPEAKETWPLTLREAIKIALDNSEIVRVVSFGVQGKPLGGCEPTALRTGEAATAEPPDRAPIVIARLNADAAVWRFQAEVMAQVRSVEQQYWNLAQAHVQLWAADRAVSIGKEVLSREQAELQGGRGTVADVAEAAQRLEQFNLDLVTRTSDVLTTERQLRNLLGLPPADNRRIIPITAPTEARLEPDWDSSLAQMLKSQPDIVQQRILVRLAELQLIMARNQLLPQLSLNAIYQLNGLGQSLDSAFAVMTSQALKALTPVIANPECAAEISRDAVIYNDFINWQSGYTFQMPLSTGRSSCVNARSAQYVLLRSRAYYQQVVHQTTHSLARFFLEIDANYKQFRTASRLRAAAAQRLDAQRAYFEEGRITIDRFLDAVSQYATAVATEAQYKTTYNVSIAALEEAKGTLLAYDNIVVLERPRPQKAAPKAQVTANPPTQAHVKPDNQVVTASLKAEKPKDAPGLAPTKTKATPPESSKSTKPASTTWSFSFSIGGVGPVQIKGTITSGEPAPAPSAH